MMPRRSPRSSVLAGVLVGGGGTRMAGAAGVSAVGVAKGLLEDETGMPIILRTRALLDSLAVPFVLLGRHPEHAARYDALNLIALADEPPGIGPIGGLLALLRYATRVNPVSPFAGVGNVLLLGCDMPYLNETLLQRLIDAPPATALAPYIDGRWQPMFARFAAAAALPCVARRVLAGVTGLQGLLDELQAMRLTLSSGDRQALRDWDCPEDVSGSISRNISSRTSRDASGNVRDDVDERADAGNEEDDKHENT